MRLKKKLGQHFLVDQNIIQKIVKFLAMVLTKLLNISGSESLSVAGNIFLGQTEAPLLVKGYLDKMNKSKYAKPE